MLECQKVGKYQKTKEQKKKIPIWKYVKDTEGASFETSG